MKKLIILILLIGLTGCQQDFGSDIKSYPVQHITAPENNTFKVGVKNYREEFKDDITDDKALQYKLGDKYIAFKPLGMRWDTTEFKIVASSLKENKEYKEVFGKGIDLEMKTGGRVWSKIITINSLKDLGDIPKDIEYLNIEFAVDTNFIIDGWNKNDKFEINDTVRVGDFSYLEPAMAWTSSSTLNKIQIKSYFEKGKYVKQIPIEFLKIAEYPIFTDADIVFGTANEYHDAGQIKQTAMTELDTDKFVVCHMDDDDGDAGDCRVATVSGTTFTWGATKEFEADASYYSQYSGIGLSKLNTDKFSVAFVDGDGGANGEQSAVTVSGTTIGTFGTKDTYESGDAENADAVELDTDKFVVCYNDANDSDTGKCVVSTVSGTSITTGSPTNYSATDYYPIETAVCKLDTNKFISCWESTDTGDGYCIAGTVSTRTITWGTIVTFEANSLSYIDVACVDTDKFIITWSDNTDGGADAMAGTVSTRTITLGSEYEFLGNTLYGLASAVLSSTEALIAYSDLGQTQKGYVKKATIDWGDKSITFGNAVLFNNNTTSGGTGDWALDIKTVNSSEPQKVVICYQNDGLADDGYCIIGDVSSAVETTPTINRPDVIWFD